MAKLLSANPEQIEQQLIAMRKWFSDAKGQRLLALEAPLLQRALNYFFGRYLLHYKSLDFTFKLPQEIKELISLGCKNAEADIVTAEENWPILTDSVDVVVLQHSLDFAISPHDLLREAARCIRPGGYLLIAGLNPYSLWGVFHRYQLGPLNYSHSITCRRLLDWLRLLGFSLEKQWTGGYCLPTGNRHQADKLTRIESMGQHRKWWGNGFYIVSARKMMFQLTPLDTKEKLLLNKFPLIPLVNRSDVKIDERDC